jgi:hypothetical protein
VLVAADASTPEASVLGLDFNGTLALEIPFAPTESNESSTFDLISIDELYYLK